jgi:hypothetical protein
LMLGLALILSWPLQDLAFATLQPFVMVLSLAFSVGLTFALFEIWWETALVRHIPADALSRVSSYDWMGSLALLPLGFAIAGPLASAIGARTVLGVGAAVTFVTLLAAMTPRSTRQLSLSEQVADHVVEEARGEAQIAHVDALIGVVHQRVDLKEPLVAHREEPVGHAVGERAAEPR